MFSTISRKRTAARLEGTYTFLGDNSLEIRPSGRLVNEIYFAPEELSQPLTKPL